MTYVDLSAVTASIIDQVRSDGDRALRELSLELDAVELDEIEVPRIEFDRALDEIGDSLRSAMERAARNIAKAHSILPVPTEVETEQGVIVGRRPHALNSVGIYAPGGRAAYPSSLLMCAIPARLAGVREVVVCSPRPTRVTLAAAAIAKVDRMFAVGGAGAIAAMAYGTETIPRVDKIVGPGNRYVCEAKLQVCRVVAIDMPAGPSELLIIADDSADPEALKLEAEAQREHDPLTVVETLYVSDSGDAGRMTLEQAIAYANRIAPEHLLLAIKDPESALDGIRNVGTVFLGQTSSVTFGDYMTGGNHVLPTGGMARCYSGLSTLDFIRWTGYQKVSRAAAASLAPDVATFAEAERLPAHAAAARLWENGR